ncbi:MAG: polysaccharide biosynthesis tyrosine autokinase, partial [Planctomycetota bacterium]
ATALQRLGQNHRAVQDLKAQLLVVDETLQKIMAQKEKEIREYQKNVAHTSFLNAMQAELQLRERMLEAEAMQRDLDQALTVYRQLEEDQLLLEHQLTQIREHINLLKKIIKDRDMVRVRQIGQAQLPKLRSFPNHLLNIPAGSILGLLLGIGLAFLLEFIDTSVKTSQDIVRHVHIPLLGTVPDLDDEELDIKQMELAAHTAPHSMIAEAFRTIRANLQLSAPAEKQKTVLITSARPEEGKTSIAMNLAISIGQSGRRVLLLDTNFRRPILHQMFPNAPREGLSNLLIGQGRIEDLTAPSDLPNIDVMTSGPVPPNPTELLAGQYLKDILNQLGQNYDQIIIDGPPVLLVTDVLVMASNVDGMILVCRAKTSSRGAIMRAREQLERVNAHVFGAVLNAARVSRGGYFREQIRTYYDYQPEEALAPTTIAPSLPGEQGDGLDIQDDRNNEPR